MAVANGKGGTSAAMETATMREKQMPMSIEIDAPLITAAVGKDFEGTLYRMITPHPRAQSLPVSVM